MKKNTKGAIALGAAAMLLAGGAGTYAAWSDEASLGGGTVTAGQLKITPTSTGAWTWGDDTTFVPGTDRIVPGDTVKYSAAYQLDVEGKNLVASLTPALGGVSGGLVDYLDVNATTSTPGITLSNITSADDGKTINVTTTITFKADTKDTEGMEESANLAGSTITLEQTAPARNTTP